jgi:DNA modification methylase
VRTDAEIEAAQTPYLITNYERLRDGDITPANHDIAGASLDEGSVLRSLGSKTYQVFLNLFADIEYKWVCTATPSPNRYRELIYYANWLGIMDTGQALTRFFQRDVNKAGNLTLHPQHEKKFWLWVASWALFVYKPSDLGYSDEGYDLPKLNVTWHRLEVDQTRAWDQTDNRGQHRLFLNAAGGVREASAEKRATIEARIEKMQEIMGSNPDRHWLLWHDLEDERRAIERAVPDSTSVYGSQALDLREQRILDFSHGEIPILATKPRIAGSGCNFQRYCHSNIFLGVGYKFQDFIQAIHRTHRFQQYQPVDVHIIYAESEDEVVNTLRRKWTQHDKLVEKMQKIVKEYGLVQATLDKELSRNIGLEREEASGQLFTAVNNDCVLELERLPDNSVGLIHTSIPFGNHYEYTTQYEDFGHNPSNSEFWQQMDFLISNLLRVLEPGRCAAVHVKDRVLYGHQTSHGFMEIAPFSDECVFAFKKHGFMYEGRRTIVTDVVRENNSTYRLGWTEMSKDASKMGSGLPEYLLLFRKQPSDMQDQRADRPVTKDKAEYSRARWQIDAHSFWRSGGNTLLTPAEAYDHDAHVERLEVKEEAGNLPATFFYEPPVSISEWVWDDITFMRVLNSEQRRKQQANHICPLPFDIVERAIRLYSNPNDLVLDPFAGLFTVPAKAIELGRRAYGIELNYEYFVAGLKYCQEAEQKAMAPTLFDWLALQEEAELAENGNGTEPKKEVINA